MLTLCSGPAEDTDLPWEDAVLPHAKEQLRTGSLKHEEKLEFDLHDEATVAEQVVETK